MVDAVKKGIKMRSLLERNNFITAVHARDVGGIISQLNTGNNINTDVVGIRVFDVLLSIHTAEAEKGIKAVLRSPNWNPNYRAVDLWHPEERAMIHHREDLAIKVIAHPNFNRAEYPRVVQSAKTLKANKVLKFMGQRMRS